jgi:putative transposase
VTTDSNHTRKVYPNLARDMVLTAINQLWRADITYIRLRDEFVFLAVLLDAYSRRTVERGLVHHSDRGSPATAKRKQMAAHRTDANHGLGGHLEAIEASSHVARQRAEIDAHRSR